MAEVVGQNAPADPSFHAGLAVVAAAAESEAALEDTDAAFDAGPEAAGGAESWALFNLTAALAERAGVALALALAASG